MVVDDMRIDKAKKLSLEISRVESFLLSFNRHDFKDTESSKQDLPQHSRTDGRIVHT